MKKFLRKHWIAAIFLVIGGIAFLYVAAVGIISEIQGRRVAAWNIERAKNLQWIGVAIHGYQDEWNRVCPAVISDSTGQPLLSWRVAILPFFRNPELSALHRQFKLNEAWDSPHNKALLEKMPRIFESPASDAAPGYTHFLAFVTAPGHERCIYRPIWGTKQSISLSVLMATDGPANTALVVEARQAVPWTKPEDILIDSSIADLDKPLGFDLGSTGYSKYSGLAQICLADASVRTIFMPRDNPKRFKELLRPLIGYNDGEMPDEAIWADTPEKPHDKMNVKQVDEIKVIDKSPPVSK